MTQIASPTADSVSATKQTARRLAGAVFVICLIPITLNLLGMDFGTRGPAFDIETAVGLSPGEQTHAMLHSLKGSYTHTLLEWSAFYTAIFTVMFAFVVFRIKGDATTPIIAMVLFWGGCMDAFHTLAADRLIEATVDNKNLLPFTWAICRAFNALIGIAGVAVVLARGHRKRTYTSNFTAIALVSVVFGCFAYEVIHYCAISENLPKTMFPNSLVKRPWDAIVLILFVVNAGAFWLLYKRIGGVFAAAMLVSTIPDIATQLHMAFGSTSLFDNHFNIAHFLKIIAYLVPFVGLSIDYVATYSQQNRLVQEMKSEIAARIKAESVLSEKNTYIHLFQEITSATNDSSNVDEVYLIALREICLHIGWSVGHVYVPAHDTPDELVPTKLWYLKEPGRFSTFKRVTEETTFPKGIGLPGRVLANASPAWIIDVNKDDNFPRAKLEVDLGVYAGFAFPVMAGDEVVAVLEFFSEDTVPTNDLLLELTKYIGTQLGRVVERTRNLQSINESENRQRAILETAPDAIITISQDGMIESINAAGLNMFGYTAQELIGKNIKILMPSPYQEQHDGYLGAYLRTGQKKTIGISREVLGRRKNGSTFPISLAMGEFKRGGQSYFTGIVQDISIRKQAEEALRQSEKRFDLAVRGTSDGLWDWNIVTNEVWYAPRFKKLLGYQDDEFPPVFESWENALHPEDKEQTLQAIQQHLEEQRVFDIEFRLKRKDDKYRWFRARGAAEHDESKKPVRMAGSIQNIHDQKIAQQEINRYAGDLWRAREATRASQKRFEIAVDGTTDGLWDWNIVTNEVWYAPRFKELLGYTDNDFPNVFESWKAILHPDHRRAVKQALTRHLEEGHPYNVECRAQTKRGEYRWFRSRGKTLRDKSGKPVRMAGSIQDITDRKKAEVELARRAQELEQSNKELDDFAYIASHDLKEPLRGIHNYATFLIEDYEGTIDEDGMSKLATLQRLTQRMEKLIDTLLEFSRVGRVDMAYEKTDLNQVLNEVIESLQVRLDEIGIDVRMPNLLPTVQCDRARIGEVFRNLITNAMKYNDKPEKWIEVGVADNEPQNDISKTNGDENGKANTDRQHIFYVRDNGIGIPEKHMDSIFRIFKRLHGRDKFGGGTGAGLTIVKKIVERHGGQVWVESTHGQGTMFKFTLGKAA